MKATKTNMERANVTHNWVILMRKRPQNSQDKDFVPKRVTSSVT